MIKFGTSGFRGVIAQNFTKENVQKVAFALAKTHKSEGTIPLGFDNRFMGCHFAKWVAEVLVAYGFKVKFFETSVPSPLIAFETANNPFGIIITASHNPYYYNGIKLFKTGGREFTAEENARLEKIANRAKKIKTLDFDVAKKSRQIVCTKSLSAYQNAVLKNVDKSALKAIQKPFIINAMGGSSAHCLNDLISKLGANAKVINAHVNPNFGFGLPAPYQGNLGDQMAEIKAQKAGFGFALDGDGDRVSFLDENGKFYDCNYIAALVYDNLCQKGAPCDFVKNCAMTGLIDKIAAAHNQKVIIAKTGFKHTAQKMLENPNAFLGAESNGIAFANHLLFKDGIFAGLKIAGIIAQNQRPLSKQIQALKKKYNYPCEVLEFAYPHTDSQRAFIQKTLFEEKRLPKSLGLKVESVSYDDGLKITYENGYWGVLRFSGNENVIRLFAEMPTQEMAEKMIAEYEKLIRLKTRQE
ncbi:MAG: hypothetical protein IJ975_01485 [Clostridia bacterium]|nr:hypothetical protein [Clostridia bacterium]